MKKTDLKNFKLPDNPGVYFFRKGKEILYIGKATSLKDRVRSYFSNDLIDTRGQKIVNMIKIADTITWETTDSVLEALILEADLIKKHQPPANSAGKDDRSYNYVVITDEDFPRIFTVRGRELEKLGFEYKKVFGPFPHGLQLATALKIIRRIFPFRDKRSSQAVQERFYKQLALAPDLSTSAAKKEYGRTVRNIELLFKGQKLKILERLDKQMHAHAKAREFENAEKIKRQIFALKHIQDIALIKGDMGGGNADNKALRVEGYDIAHMHGKNTVGVMTVSIGSEARPDQYKKFRIRADTRGSDTDALHELLERRLGHPEWGMPDLVVIDGGVAQKRRAQKIFTAAGVDIPIVSVVKDERHRPRNILGPVKFRTKYEREILLVNAEAHRFAIVYHKKLRGKELLGKSK